MNIDKFNERILRELQKDGRITNSELADRIGLSASACLRRVQDLEKTGIIKGYRAVVDQVKLGKGFVAYVIVGLKTHSKEAQQTFEQAIIQSEEVVECHNVTGSFEYILRVESEDLATYKNFHTDVLGDLPQVATILTNVVMDSPKDVRA